MSHCRRREYQAFFCKILCRLVTPRHASAHANHHNISLDLLAAASRGTGASRRGQAARRSVRRVQMSLKAATSASRCVLGYRRSDVSSQRMAASGHQERFPPRSLRDRCGFREPTFAATPANTRNASAAKFVCDSPLEETGFEPSVPLSWCGGSRPFGSTCLGRIVPCKDRRIL